MPSFFDISFTLIEWLAVMGLAQGVLVLVYMFFRVRDWRQAAVPVLYFGLLSAAFALQFAQRLDDYQTTLRLLLWLCWSLGPAVSTLLVLQVARLAVPPARHFWLLVLVPLSFAVTVVFNRSENLCDNHALACARFYEWLYLLGAMAGALSLLFLWAHRGIFAGLWSARGGRERYWLVMMLLAANAGVVLVNLLRASESPVAANADAVLVILGLAFVYLASTFLFRIYPVPVAMDAPRSVARGDLNAEEEALARRVRELMERDKLYQEPSFSRADLARELHCSESVLSRVINAAFGKSFPKMLNEYRVADAQRLLADPSIAIQVVAAEVGFNSLASFNRVFKETTGQTPSAYRAGAGLVER